MTLEQRHGSKRQGVTAAGGGVLPAEGAASAKALRPVLVFYILKNSQETADGLEWGQQRRMVGRKVGVLRKPDQAKA